jgi:hypothetical protein
MKFINYFRKLDNKDSVILLIANGWVFRWDLTTVKLIGGNGCANSICLHEDTLYQADLRGVVAWTNMGPLIFHEDYVSSIHSYNGYLFVAYGSSLSLSASSQIYRFKIVNNERVSTELIAQRKSNVTSFCIYKEKLYDCTYGGEIFETLTNKRITNRRIGIYALCSHGDILYDAGFQGIYESFSGKIIVNCIDGIGISSMCSHKGKLYYSQYKGVFDAEMNTMKLKFEDVKYSHKSKISKAFDKSYGKPVSRYPDGKNRIRSVVDMLSIQYEKFKPFEKSLREFKNNN